MRYYVDTSAAAKLLVNEVESETVAAFLDEVVERGDQLTSSYVLETESRRLAARDGLDQAVVTELMKRFALLLPDRELYRDAGLIPGPALRSLDALHIASALRLRAGVLVTYDARQRLAARSVGLQTVSPGVPIEGLEPRPLGTDAGHFKVPDDFDDEVNDL